MTDKMKKKIIKIMLVKSGIGQKNDQKKTLIGLGLTRMGKYANLKTLLLLEV